jgi:regulator of sirC expression with transglutaminase-like and TPR domain
MHDCLDRPAAFLRRLGGGAEHARLPVAEAALALAVLDRPALDASRGGRNRYLAHLDELAREVALEADRGIAALWLALGGTFAYRGDAKTYDDLANADLMQVIDRRRGLPVTLGILYLHAARAQGWQASGLAFPGHFLIRVERPAGRHASAAQLSCRGDAGHHPVAGASPAG